MLRNLRKKSSSWIARAVIFVIAASFGLWGIQSFVLTNPEQVVVLSVDGVEMDAGDYEQLNRNLASTVAAELGDARSGDLDGILESPGYRRRVFDRLFLRALERSAVERHEFNAPVSVVNQFIVDQPSFQSGSGFDGALLSEFLNLSGLSLEDYQDLIREDLSMELYASSLNDSFFVPDIALEFLVNQRYTEKDFSVLPISITALAESLELDEENLTAYWEEKGIVERRGI